jgi:hypothetical protein
MVSLSLFRFDPMRTSARSSSSATVENKHLGNSRTKKSQKNLLILRCLLFFALMVAGGLSGGLSYYFIRKYQNDKAKRHFNTMIEDHSRSLQKLLHLQLYLNIQVATAFELACPSSSDWPNCAMPFQEFYSRTRSLLPVSAVTQFVFLPIVRPENRSSFEEFALNYYETDGKYPNGTGYSVAGAGIYNFDEDGTAFRTPNHTDPNTSKHDFLTPIFLKTKLSGTEDFLYNPYSQPYLRDMVDDILDCVNRTQASSEPYVIQHLCSTSFHLPDPVSSEYASLVITPIFSGSVVGFTLAVFSWEDALVATPYQEFEFQVSIDCTHCSNARSYHVKHDKAVQTDHINKNQQLKGSFTLRPEASSKASDFFTISYYSSNESPSQFFPIVTCLCCVGVTCTISLIFFGYLVLSDRESLATNMLLDSKRTYVRFISHEIRYSSTTCPCPCPSPPNPLLLLCSSSAPP